MQHFALSKSTQVGSKKPKQAHSDVHSQIISYSYVNAGHRTATSSGHRKLVLDSRTAHSEGAESYLCRSRTSRAPGSSIAHLRTPHEEFADIRRQGGCTVFIVHGHGLWFRARVRGVRVEGRESRGLGSGSSTSSTQKSLRQSIESTFEKPARDPPRHA
eukprot:3578017-Rhodomonas_salina.1